MSDAELAARIEVYRANGLCVSRTARALGLSRNGFQHTVRLAIERGVLRDEEIHQSSAPAVADYVAARERKVAAFAEQKRRGDWRKPVLITLPARPFRLKLFGDPHLDADGCDYDLFERHWLEMDAEAGIYGICVGDFFDNWTRSLAHLWRETTTPPSDAWTCLEFLMEQRGDALIAACSGNHDDWTHAPADPVDLLMKRHGVVYRKGAARIAVGFGDAAAPVMIGLRHKWRGSSIYSAAHGILRAAIWGWRDHLMVGGHIHQDEPRLISFPDGFRAHACQLSAFKRFDQFADTEGFIGPRISPVWDVVVDPFRADDDPDKIKVFWSPEAAAGYLDFLRRRRP